jgi:hypothetical protein
MPDPDIQRGLVPYDLVPPSRLLTPWPHQRRNIATATAELGHGDTAVTVEVTTWDACQPGCTGGGPAADHQAGRVITLAVPCDSLPHCHTCECLDGHRTYLTATDLATLKAILP